MIKPMSKMPALASRFATVRMAVAFLGQAGLSGWWTSSFLTPNGIAIAQYNFPRGAAYAALNATVAAAKRLHDERIGKRRCVHLFRFTLADEVLIQSAIQESGSALLDSMPRTREDALQLLTVEGQEIISVEAGPVQVGTAAHAFTEVGLGELAKHYLAAFRQDTQCLPYFANVKK